MLSKPGFGDRELADSFYQALFNRFYDSFDSPIQTLLIDCQFGLAPSPTGVQTFFILAPNMAIAEELTQRIEIIIKRTSDLMAGIAQTGICVAPQKGSDPESSPGRSNAPAQYMLAKIFPHPSTSRCNVD
ncbi:hypothetical protein [Phormidium sp. CCY1219]|uniref:hypothetical protein n=1 Tax=Phormidium sp. CCY1219 TaxID=2886104 RepID=UPI002D1E766A|nr:hypothetical protein [Phormidium sp. CCY1219]MEB3829985.1 hypothetical protein [Phormidium sp. CCY1219]